MSNVSELANQSIRELAYPMIPRGTSGSRSRPIIDLYKNINAFDHPYANYPALDDSELRRQYIVSLSTDGLDEENVMFTAGITEACELIYKTFLQPGVDRVAVAVPTFGLYQFLAKLFSIEVLELHYIDQSFNLNAKKLITIGNLKAKVIFLCSPNNPTGQVIPASLIKKILDSLGSKQLLVVDEAYIDFSNEESAAALVKSYDRLVIMRTFSKAWAAAGLRLGAIITSKEIIRALQVAQLPFTINTPTLDYFSDFQALENKKKHESKQIMHQRDLLIQELKQFSWVDIPCQSHGNFIFLITDYADDFSSFLLKNFSIMVSNVTHLFPGGLRISIGSIQNQKLLLDAFNDYSRCVVNNEIKEVSW